MCGIVGILDGKQTPSRDLIQKMARIIEHRGPDGEGFHIEGPIALGHRRLSIIDLAGGAQPLSNEDGSIWITYNGEVYNFPELRKELRGKGHVFKTRSDTETIVHAYEEWGNDCPKRLRGMFAFAIWDENKKTLFLARDRMGKKPLYYHCDGRRFLFASEIKAILQDSQVERQLDPGALLDYLNYHYIPFPQTIFKGIKKLPPAHSLTVRIGGNSPPEAAGQGLELEVEKYWDIEYRPDHSLSEEDWAEALRAKLEEAVRIRLISEVPLGAFLSGGIDSSAVVALMSRVQSAPVKTFSIGFKEEDFSELQYARQIAELFGTEHHEYVVEPDAMEVLPRLAWEFDEPFADSSAIPTYYVSKLARENVTVVLSGDGGDETFAGYRRYRWANDMGRHDWLPDWFRKAAFGIPASLMPEGMKGKGTLQHLSRDPFERYAGLNTFGERSYLNGLLSGDVLSGLQGESARNLPDYGAMRLYYEACRGHDYLTRIQHVDTKTYLAEDILTKVDRASMLCSLETRAPLLDHEVVELAARIPSTLKLKNGETKYILKKAMTGILPDNILYRRKMGFGVPLVHWFKKDLTSYARDILLSQEARERGIFDSASVEALLLNHQKKGRDLSARIWALLFFEHWCRNWLK
ncbi:MAG: asparagine synthase (glutamine-hydrolyzing) [Desulfuromonadales bacterium]|nr:asparagine synthase (glutamine-hydrolyzing) [Desulfuromonadales bacterium]